VTTSSADLDVLCAMVTSVLDSDGAALVLWGESERTIGCSGLDRGDASDLARPFEPGPAPAAATSDLRRIGFATSVRSSLTRDGRVVGLLFVLMKSESRPDLPLVDALARCCESAIEYGLHSTAAPLSSLDALVLHSDSFRVLLPALTAAIREQMPEVGVGLSVLDADSGLLKTADGSFGLPTEVTKSYSIDPNDLHSNAARVFELQRPFASNRVIGDPAILQNYPIAFGISSMVALPLSVAGRSTGVLMIADKPGGFSAADVEVASRLLPQISVAVELARLNQARIFAHESEQVLAELSVASPEDRLDIDRLRPALGRAAAILELDELRLVEGKGTVLSIQPDHHSLPPLRFSSHALAFECGAPVRSALLLEVTRTLGGVFSPAERQFAAETARALGETMSRAHARRQEAELVQHRERRRIADDLHDDVSQLLFAAQLALDAGGRASHERGVREASDLIRRAETALRDAIFVLHLPQSSLSAELAGVISAVHAEWGLEVAVEVDETVDAVVSPEVAAEITRSARECLVNTAKHAGRCTARVQLRLSDDGADVELLIADTGRGGLGTSPPRSELGGHGLAALRRRAAQLGGKIEFRSEPSQGTAVTVTIPATARI
jgi:signal transduction histidine kinase